MTIGAVSVGCRERLTFHYGEPVLPWLEQVPELLSEAAHRWQLRLTRYHDAGHASVLALGLTTVDTTVMLKAWFDQERFTHKIAALRHWEPANGQVVRACDHERAIACLALIGGAPAGMPRPADGDLQVAAALRRVHQRTCPKQDFPLLGDYLAGEVEPRVRSRTRRFTRRLPSHCMRLGLGALEQRQDTGHACVLLHADLYRENVAFTDDGSAVFLDPLPMVGDAAFDWAFFIVYYDLSGDPVARLRLARGASGIPGPTLLPWCLMLCLDGLLYYHEVRDEREPRMAEVMTALASEA